MSKDGIPPIRRIQRTSGIRPFDKNTPNNTYNNDDKGKKPSFRKVLEKAKQRRDDDEGR